MKTKTQKQNKFVRFITLPIRVLGKAKDLYVRSVMDCAPKVTYGSSVGYSTYQLPILPKSYSARSSRSNDDEDFRDLVKAASVRSLDIKNIIDDDNNNNNIILQDKKLRQSSKGLPKSCSLGMGRIDEDSAYEFEDGIDDKNDLVYPRSRSYAVVNRRSGF